MANNSVGRVSMIILVIHGPAKSDIRLLLGSNPSYCEQSNTYSRQCLQVGRSLYLGSHSHSELISH